MNSWKQPFSHMKAVLVSYSWNHSEALFLLQVRDVLTNDKDYKPSHGERKKKRGLAFHEADYMLY